MFFRNGVGYHAGSLSIQRLEGSAPDLAGQFAYWVLNRRSNSQLGNVATGRLIGRIAVTLPDSITRKRPPLGGFVEVGFASAMPGGVTVPESVEQNGVLVPGRRLKTKRVCRDRLSRKRSTTLRSIPVVFRRLALNAPAAWRRGVHPVERFSRVGWRCSSCERTPDSLFRFDI
jgi:hypothetical protein